MHLFIITQFKSKQNHFQIVDPFGFYLTEINFFKFDKIKIPNFLQESGRR